MALRVVLRLLIVVSLKLGVQKLWWFIYLFFINEKPLRGFGSQLLDPYRPKRIRFTVFRLQWSGHFLSD